MQRLIFSAAYLAGAAVLAAGAVVTGQSARGDAPASVVVDNARVRVFRTTGASLAGVAHGPGVVVPLADGAARKMGEAYWAADAAIAQESMRADGPLVIVEPQAAEVGAAPTPNASRPGEATFVGMSFKTLFENERVTTMRARMDVNAREGLHTHASDTIVVHLSGGTIEDTANGTTTVNRWKPGDVEFEARGSSHSARNVGQAVDVVLVALKLKT
jgi:quercetin dioxygenase-like cupin family protein